MTTGDNGVAARRHPAGLPEDDMKLTVGAYQVVGEEQVLLTDMLLWNTLRKIKSALACLRERLDHSRTRRMILAPAQPEGDLGHGSLAFEPKTDVDHVQQMMHGFEANIQVLENILDGNERMVKEMG